METYRAMEEKDAAADKLLTTSGTCSFFVRPLSVLTTFDLRHTRIGWRWAAP